MIGRNKYQALKSFTELTEDEKHLVQEYENKNKITGVSLDKITDYFDRIKNPSVIPIEEKELSYLVAKERFIKVSDELIQFKTKGKKKHLEYHSENVEVVEFLFKYFTGQQLPEGVTDNISGLEKGIILAGNWGSGKTTLFEIFQKLGFRFRFGHIMSHDIVSEFDKNGESEIEKYFKGNLFLDEVGAESMGVHFGKKEEVLSRIFEMRYTEYLRKGKVTFITTNLTKSQLSDKYGGRFGSRMDEMFNIIYLGKAKDSRDFRKEI